MHEEVIDEFLAALAREGNVLQRRFECGPVFETELAGERVLQVSQRGVRGCAGPRNSQARVDAGVVGTNGVQPAFRFFAEILETALSSELADHEPSFRCCPKSA